MVVKRIYHNFFSSLFSASINKWVVWNIQIFFFLISYLILILLYIPNITQTQDQSVWINNVRIIWISQELSGAICSHRNVNCFWFYKVRYNIIFDIKVKLHRTGNPKLWQSLIDLCGHPGILNALKLLKELGSSFKKCKLHFLHNQHNHKYVPYEILSELTNILRCK